MKAGLYFSAAFTAQRMLISELAYLALAPFLLSPAINGIVCVVVGIAMSAAGVMVLRKNRYPHFHLLAEWHELARMEPVSEKSRLESAGSTVAPLPRWTIIHGFIAGFGFGGFSLRSSSAACCSRWPASQRFFTWNAICPLTPGTCLLRCSCSSLPSRPLYTRGRKCWRPEAPLGKRAVNSEGNI